MLVIYGTKGQNIYKSLDILHHKKNFAISKNRKKKSYPYLSFFGRK